MPDTIVILDFGSQYSQLIARRVRELNVYCELLPWDTPAEQARNLEVKGFILSGGPASVYEPGAPFIPEYVLESQVPILGICYGMQALTQALGGVVGASHGREYGLAQLECTAGNRLIALGSQQVWMSHGDRIEVPPPGFDVLGQSENSPVAIIGDTARHYYGLQFHPEVHHTPGGKEILRRFVLDICQVIPDWTPQSIIAQSISRIQSPGGQGNGDLGCQRWRRLQCGNCHGTALRLETNSSQFLWTPVCCARVRARRCAPPCTRTWVLS